MRKPGLQTLRMLWPSIQTSTMRCAHHHRHTTLTAEHEVRLRSLIHNGVHREGHEIHQHDFNDGPHSCECCADGHTCNCRLRNWCVAHSLAAKALHQSAGDSERATRHRNIFSQKNYGRIGLHSISQGFVDCGPESNFSHGWTPPQRIRRPMHS